MIPDRLFVVRAVGLYLPIVVALALARRRSVSGREATGESGYVGCWPNSEATGGLKVRCPVAELEARIMSSV